MAQTGYTPILIYSSSTTTNAPAAGSLTNSTLGSELAINITDGKLFYKDNANAIQVIAWKTTPTTAGGTGLTSYTAGDLLYYASGTVLSKLGIGAAGNWLGSSGTAPQWNAPAALTKTDDTNVTLTLGGSASTALLNAASITVGWTGTLATSRGGTGLSSFTANGIAYASSTSALATGSALTFDGTNFSTTGSATVKNLLLSGGTLPAAGNPSLALRSSDNTVYLQSGSANSTILLDSSQNTMYQATSTSHSWLISNATQMRLHSSGGVSIGNTTDPGATNLYVTGDIYSGSSTSAGTTNPTTFTIAGRLRSTKDKTASIANGATADITLTYPRAMVAYLVQSDQNTAHMSAGFFRTNDNGASSTITLFGQSENLVAVTSPAAGTIRITNNTGGAAAFNYVFTIIAGL